MDPRQDETLTGLPDYVGVGTIGSGTRWWHELICRHPRVSCGPMGPRELHFFRDLWHHGLQAGDAERYQAQFRRPVDTISGEWSPDYLHDPWSPAMLREVAPEARLLVLLRDPVERFRADWRPMADRGHASLDPSLDPGADPTAQGEQPAVTVRAAANAAFSRGLYADQLQRLWRSFPRDQVLVLQAERCRSDPWGQLARTLDFLGLGAGIPTDLPMDIADQPSDDAPATLDPWQARELARRYAPENERLATLCPELDLSLWQAPR